MYRSLLVPLDGSPEGEHALTFAHAIAQQVHAALHLVHVHVPQVPVYTEGMPVIDADLHSLAQEHAHAYLHHIAQRLQLPDGRSVTSANLDGPVVPALLEYVASHQIDLVVMTTHGRSGLARAWLGSVADGLVRQSPVPIMLIRPQQDVIHLQAAPVFRRLLLPLDGSPLAEAILAPALAFGRLWDASYTLIQVVEPAIMGVYLSGMPELSVNEEWTRQRQIKAVAYLQDVASRLHDDGVALHTEVITATQPAPAILDYAETRAFDAIAVATHGLGGLARLLLGGVADKIVRSAERPVLIYRPPQHADYHRT